MIRDHSKHIRQHENKHEIYIQFKKNIHIWFHLVLLSKWPEWYLYTQSRCIASHHIILPLRLIWTFKLKWCKWFDTKLLIHCWIHSRKAEEKKLILIDETKKQKKNNRKISQEYPNALFFLMKWIAFGSNLRLFATQPIDEEKEDRVLWIEVI